MYDVIIIGAGVVGCATARELSRYRLNMLVLEKGADVCAGASKGNSAMVHGGFDPDPGTLKAKYNILGNPMFDDLCRDLEVPFTRTGTMLVGTSDEEVAELQRLHERGKINGCETQLLFGAELHAKYPDLGPRVVAALFAPSGGIVCPYGLVIALAECAAINGVEFALNTQAEKITKNEHGWRVEAADGRVFESRTVINCAGTDSARLNNMVSSDQFQIHPRFGAHLLLSRSCIDYVDFTVTQTPHKLPGGGHTKGMGIMPSVDGTVILGCDAIEREDGEDTSIPMESVNYFIEYFSTNWDNFPIARALPQFPRNEVIGAYGGVRAHCDRNDFIIGAVADAPGFFNAAGIESPGLTAGPAIAVDLAGMVAAHLDAAPNEAFFAGRKALKPFREMDYAEREAAIAADPNYAKLVCRCELVTEAEIRDAIRRPLGARSLSAVKMRTRAGMGRCQSGFCSPRVLEILHEELGLDQLQIELAGPGSNILTDRVGALCREEGCN